MSEKRLNKPYYYFRDLFFVSGALLLVLLIIDDFQPGFVSFWLEMKYILSLVFISGLLSLLGTRKQS